MKLGILSDIHEDIDSLKMAMNIFEKYQCNELVCLGDILGFDINYYRKVVNPNANECLNIIQNEFKYVVIGNHDLFAIKKIPKHRGGLFNFPDNWYSIDIKERNSLCYGKIFLYENDVLSTPLSEDHKNYLWNLPENITIDFNDNRLHFSHSIYPDFSGTNHFRYYNHWEIKPHFNYMSQNQIKLGFSGHTHSTFPQIVSNGSFNKISYKTIELNTSLTHYFCPCTVNGKSKRGVAIVDFNNNNITFYELKSNLIFKFISNYGSKKQKN